VICTELMPVLRYLLMKTLLPHLKYSILRKAFPAFLQLTLSLLILNVFSFKVTAQRINENHPAYNAKDFRRSEQFAGNRADQSGSMRSYVIASERAKDSIRSIIKSRAEGKSERNSYRPVQFYPLGPSKTTDSVFSQLGLVSALWVDTTDYQTIYAGSNTGGIFATNDGGQNWRSLADNYMTTGVQAIEVDPKDKKHIYIGTGHWGFSREWGEGVMQSFDGGETWQSTSLNAGIMNVGFVVHDLKYLDKYSDTLIAIANTEFQSGTYIFRSTDKGTTWTEVFSHTKAELFDIVKSPENPLILYAVGSLYLKSTDGGATWTDLTYKITLRKDHKIARMALTISSQRPYRQLAFLETYDTIIPGEYDHWLLKYPGHDPREFENVGIWSIPYVSYWKMELQFSKTNPNEFYLGGIWFFKYALVGDSAIYLNYHNHKYHKDVRDLLVYKGPQGDIVFMGNDGGVTRSDNGTVKWYDITRNGMQSTQFYNIAIGDKSNMVFCGPQDGNLCFFNYNTGEWSIDTHIGDAYDGLVDYNNPKNVYLVTYPPKQNRKNIFLLKSVDGGLTFSYRGVPDTTEQGRNNVPIAMDATNPAIIYAGLKNVWKSEDGAETWKKISSFNPFNPHKIQAVDVSPSHPNVICISFENPAWGDASLEKLMITTNGGQKWTDITPRGDYNLQWASAVDILIHPEDPATIYLALDRIWANRRIYVTHDGGRTWGNFSEGLPNLPVNAIKFFKGAGYDILFAANDAGIYYRDQFMDQWEYFGEGLPLTIVSDIDINYKKKKLVAGTFGRGLWEADLCLPLDDNEQFISGNQTWPAGKNILSDLTLMPGSKLTMSGKVEVGEGRLIKVMPGAQLVLDEATLTNNCLTLWQGIKLYGNPDYSSNGLQGRVTLLHNSAIENSYFGIETNAMDNEGNIDTLKGGGIIYSSRATFKNVLRPVILKPTKGINPSKFILTEFALKEQPWPGETLKEFVKMDGNQGIDFVSCTFRNDVSSAILPVVSRGTGINSYNSTFRIFRISSDSVPLGLSTKPLFYQLTTAVNATTEKPGYAFYSNGVTYKNNLTGVYLSGYSSAVAIGNAFEMTSLVYSDTIHKLISGLYLDHIPLFRVSGNTFKTSSSFGMITETGGVVINNCGEFNNLVTDNKFDKLTYSILAQNRNKNEDGSTGLRFYFNRFSKNEYDICITHDSLNQVNGVAYYQGVPGHQIMEPAGNRFSNNNIHRTGDLHNEGDPIIYTHYANVPGIMGQVPYLNGNIWLLPLAVGMPGDSTHVPQYAIADTSEIAGQVKEWQELRDLTADNYKSIIDGGDSEELTSAIKSVNAPGTASLYKKLRDLDSKLSDNTIIELLKNNDFPNSLLIEVLVHNPVIFRKPAIMEAIFDRSPEIPGYMLHRLSDLYSRFSYSELLESAVHNSNAIFDGMIALELNNEWTSYPASINVDQNILSGFLQQDDINLIYAVNAKDHADDSFYNEPYLIPSVDPSLPVYNLPDTPLTGSGLRIYPQPASDYIIVDYHYQSGFEKGTLEFINSTGQLVKTIKIAGKEGQDLINIRDWLPGIYIARLVTDSEILEYQKIMILR